MYTLITRALSKPPKNRVIRGNWELGDKGLPYNDSLPFVHTKKNKRESRTFFFYVEYSSIKYTQTRSIQPQLAAMNKIISLTYLVTVFTFQYYLSIIQQVY